MLIIYSHLIFRKKKTRKQSGYPPVFGRKRRRKPKTPELDENSSDDGLASIHSSDLDILPVKITKKLKTSAVCYDL